MSDYLADDSAAEDQRALWAAQHNPALFAPVYERYVARIYAYCRRRTASVSDAEDLCSTVFARALAGLHTYKGGHVAAWLFGIAHNCVVNYYRARRVTLPLDDDCRADSQTAFDAVEDAHDGRIVARLIAELPDEQQDLIALAVDAGLTSPQIGALLGKNAGAVRVQLHRLFKTLRQRLIGETDYERR
ncbi:MAG: sigma-70 family RNA polymerase sigma factor [Chloroflexi bacterium]|nr:sigma-70 family RNA polymerase sigma factor [Chloroflexota bacterium]